MKTTSVTLFLVALTAGCGGASDEPPPSPAVTSCAVEVASGDAHVCARRGDGSVWCWGLNASGQLGVGDAINRPAPAQVGSLAHVAQVTAGASHACAIDAAGAAWCWGENEAGQLGDGTNTPRSRPVQVAGLAGVTQLSAGGAHTCALEHDGSVWCWGANELGELGAGTSGDGSNRNAPVEVSALGHDVAQLSARGNHTCARKNDGSVWCWGENTSGELGDGASGDGQLRATPVELTALDHDVAELAAGGAHTCARKNDGSVWCWGNNSSGQLGRGYVSYSAPTALTAPLAVQFPPSTRIASISAGQAHACARSSAGELFCWGVNGRGQLGNGQVTPAAERGVGTPAGIAGLADVGALSAGSTHSCALSGDAVFCWGGNRVGELGNNGAPDDDPTPTRTALCP